MIKFIISILAGLITGCGALFISYLVAERRVGDRTKAPSYIVIPVVGIVYLIFSGMWTYITYMSWSF